MTEWKSKQTIMPPSQPEMELSANSIIRTSEISECCNKKGVGLRVILAVDERSQVMPPHALHITRFCPA